MKWNVSVCVMLSIEYDDIEAETEEEAKEIARERAEERKTLILTTQASTT